MITPRRKRAATSRLLARTCYSQSALAFPTHLLTRSLSNRHLACSPTTQVQSFPISCSSPLRRRQLHQRNSTFPQLSYPAMSATPSLVGSHALVTGASRGIGRGVAVALGAAGATLFITGRTASDLVETARLVRDSMPQRHRAGKHSFKGRDIDRQDVAESSIEANSEYNIDDHHDNSKYPGTLGCPLHISGEGTCCVAIECDHSDDESVAQCFNFIGSYLERNGGTLDLVVNNAFGGANAIADSIDIPFWEKHDHLQNMSMNGTQSHSATGSPPSAAYPGLYWDKINSVGLRSNYVTAVYATRLMIPRRAGLIVNISSFGGIMQLFDSAYGAGKCANDRLISDIGRELEAEPDTGIRAITLYPGLVSTEVIVEGLQKMSTSPTSGNQSESNGNFSADTLNRVLWNTESPLFVGRVIAAIASDRNRKSALRRNGNIVIAAEAARHYGVRDHGGERRYSFRSLRLLFLMTFPSLVNSFFRHLIPDVYVPLWMIRLSRGASPTIVK